MRPTRTRRSVMELPLVAPAPVVTEHTVVFRDRADTTHRSRLLSEAPWRADEINRRRIRFLLQQTKAHRQRRREALVIIDDTLCAHVGSRFDPVDRHDNHRDGTYPLAHNPVTSGSVSSPVRF